MQRKTCQFSEMIAYLKGSNMIKQGQFSAMFMLLYKILSPTYLTVNKVKQLSYFKHNKLSHTSLRLPTSQSDRLPSKHCAHIDLFVVY